MAQRNNDAPRQKRATSSPPIIDLSLSCESSYILAGRLQHRKYFTDSPVMSAGVCTPGGRSAWLERERGAQLRDKRGCDRADGAVSGTSKVTDAGGRVAVKEIEYVGRCLDLVAFRECERPRQTQVHDVDRRIAL